MSWMIWAISYHKAVQLTGVQSTATNLVVPRVPCRVPQAGLSNIVVPRNPVRYNAGNACIRHPCSICKSFQMEHQASLPSEMDISQAILKFEEAVKECDGPEQQEVR